VGFVDCDALVVLVATDMSMKFDLIVLCCSFAIIYHDSISHPVSCILAEVSCEESSVLELVNCGLVYRRLQLPAF
jgi:hypothetical protein